jgi:hypothetical protein
VPLAVARDVRDTLERKEKREKDCSALLKSANSLRVIKTVSTRIMSYNDSRRPSEREREHSIVLVY